MEVTFAPGILKKIVESISDLTSTPLFDFTPSNMTIQAMDNASVSVIVVYLNKKDTNCFSDYSVTSRNISLGISMASIGKALKTGDISDSVTLSMKSGDDDDVQIIFKNPETLKKNTIFSLKLINVEYEKLGFPQIDYPAVFSIPSSLYRTTISSLKLIGDITEIRVSSDSVSFKTSGDSGTVEKLLGEEDGVSIVIDEDTKDSTNVSFALRYLDIFTKAGTLASTMKISVHPNSPMDIYFPIGKPNEQKQHLSYIRFYLAPRIDDDV